MSLSLPADRTLVIESDGVTLRGVEPVLNGAPLEGWNCEVRSSNGDHMELRYSAGALSPGAQGLKATYPNGHGHMWLQYWVEDLPPDLVLHSFGLRFRQVENLRQYLRNGYFSAMILGALF